MAERTNVPRWKRHTARVRFATTLACGCAVAKYAVIRTVKKDHRSHAVRLRVDCSTCGAATTIDSRCVRSA